MKTALLIGLSLLLVGLAPSIRDRVRASVQRNGLPVTVYLVLAISIWTLAMIIAPLFYMVEFSFHAKLPLAERGGPNDVYTLQNYRYFLFGSNSDTSHFNTIHLQAFATTLSVSFLITFFDLVLCYPLAFYLAQAAPRRRVARLMVLLVAPYWINEILRAFAFRVLLGTGGVLNAALLRLHLVAAPIDFLGDNVALYAGLTYAYVLLMMFPLYNGLESLDGNQIEAARDLGAPWWHVHAFVVLPHAKPAIASGSTLVFMLCSGALAAPLLLGGPRTLWFTPIVYDRFFQAFNWPQGAAYALVLLASCMTFVLLVMRLCRVSLTDIAR